MTPAAESASPPAQMDVAAAEELLDGGEAILLAIRPSGWFVLLTSFPVLAVSAAVSGVTAAADAALSTSLPAPSIYFVCGAVASIRLAAACGEWVGRLYILTTRRVLRVRGVVRATIDDCPLQKIAQTSLSASPGERPFGVASLLFQDDQGLTIQPAWTCLARPAEVRQAVENAIRRTR